MDSYGHTSCVQPMSGLIVRYIHSDMSVPILYELLNTLNIIYVSRDRIGYAEVTNCEILAV